MKSIAHDIEGRKGSAWLRRARRHLDASGQDAVTQHAVGITRNALEDVTADEDRQRALIGSVTR